ncbi:MAG: histidine kinase N-terminal 7TM domain-containing protein [Candidatus Pacebacteria bacterium]|nr:histidine kinase N-terminal 7TM domain-containing protein [Candidatus Paceibacterota bacterium]
MNILSTVILIAGLANLTLPILALTNKQRQRIHYLFSGFFLVFSFWVFSNFFLIVTPTPLLLKTTYALGFLSALAALLWAWEICNKNTRRKAAIMAFLAMIATAACYIFIKIPPQSEEALKQAYAGNIEYMGNGLFLNVYFVFLAGIFAFLIFTLAQGYRRAKGIQRKQVGYVLIGASLSVLSVAIANFIFPYLKLYYLTPLFDSPGSLFFAIFSFAAISRYRLLDIKVILTETLVIATGLVLLALPFLMDTKELVIATSAILAVFCAFGYMLVKNAIKESRHKETLEKEVASRTKELEAAKNLAMSRAKEAEKARKLAEERAEEINKRKEELERFYNLTVGRELKMIELKKKIGQLEEEKNA